MIHCRRCVKCRFHVNVVLRRICPMCLGSYFCSKRGIAFTLGKTGIVCNFIYLFNGGSVQMVPRGWWKMGLLEDLKYYKPFSTAS